MTPAAHFEHELELYRTEADAAAQFFYAFLAVHSVAGDAKAVYQALNTAPLFWNTTLGALQTATFIALGRIFDQDSKHNVDLVLKIAQENPSIFAKAALAVRKQGPDAQPPDWLKEYLQQAYVPTAEDFRRLRKYVGKYRKIYNERYRDLRRKVFAHKEVSDRSDVDALFEKTNVRELQKLLAFLGSLYDALWELFHNGRKPVLRPRRYSVKRIRDRPSPPGRVTVVQERITHEVEGFLRSAARLA